MIFRGNLNYHHHLNYTRNSRVEPPIPSFATAIQKRVGWEELEGKKSEAKPMTTECRFQHLGADSLGILSEKKNPTEIYQGGPLKGKSKNEEMQPSRNFWWYILDSHFWVGKEHCSTGTNTFFFWGGATPQKVWVNLGGQIKRCHTLEESEKVWVKECDLS